MVPRLLGGRGGGVPLEREKELLLPNKGPEQLGN